MSVRDAPFNGHKSVSFHISCGETSSFSSFFLYKSLQASLCTFREFWHWLTPPQAQGWHDVCPWRTRFWPIKQKLFALQTQFLVWLLSTLRLPSDTKTKELACIDLPLEAAKCSDLSVRDIRNCPYLLFGLGPDNSHFVFINSDPDYSRWKKNDSRCRLAD